MEELIRQFLSLGYGDGSGCGCGYGDGDGCGYGDGYGDGNGYGYGDGYGSGYGSGCGDGNGSGYGDGNGYGLKTLNGKTIYIIDDVQTIIETIHGNTAKGFVLQSDLTLTPCFIVKENDKFAHGETLRDAFNALQEKLYDDATEEERIAKFKEHFTDYDKKYPASELFTWHHILTGSCRFGRESFCRDKGIDVDSDEFTIREFIDITKDAYGGEVIRKL